MKYSELIQFEPIESVVQLKEAMSFCLRCAPIGRDICNLRTNGRATRRSRLPPVTVHKTSGQ